MCLNIFPLNQPWTEKARIAKAEFAAANASGADADAVAEGIEGDIDFGSDDEGDEEDEEEEDQDEAEEGDEGNDDKGAEEDDFLDLDNDEEE